MNNIRMHGTTVKKEQTSWIASDTAQITQHSRARSDFSEIINEILFINLTHTAVTDRTLPSSHCPETIYSSRFNMDRCRG
jgi:hypothetical protein